MIMIKEKKDEVNNRRTRQAKIKSEMSKRMAINLAMIGATDFTHPKKAADGNMENVIKKDVDEELNKNLLDIKEEFLFTIKTLWIG